MLVAATPPDSGAASGVSLFDLLSRLLGQIDGLLVQAAPVIGAAALVWLAIESRFSPGRILVVVLSVGIMILAVLHITVPCDLIGQELAGTDDLCSDLAGRSASGPG